MIMHTEVLPHFNTDIAELASVTAQAMLHNPIHLAIFEKADQRSEQMQTKMFNAVLKLPTCNLFTARQDGRVVGVMNYYKKGCCQISPLKTLALLPGLSLALGSKLPRVLKWKSSWAKHDPQAPHFHFGPLAVLPAFQGKGIGSALLTHFCQLADAEKIGSYLETDKEENVRLYEKFGFKAVDSAIIFGVRNWFMWREAACMLYL
jgi:ribosomal protein S18 acetylase RimI-like enzyme